MQFSTTITTVLAAIAGLISTADACFRVTGNHITAEDCVYNFRRIDNDVLMCNGAFVPSFNNLVGVLPLSCAIDTNWAANLVKVGETAEEGFRVDVLDRSGPRRFKFPLVYKCVERDGEKCALADSTANEYGR